MLDNFIIQTLEGRRVHRSPAPNGTKVDTEFQTIGEENWRKERTGLGHDARARGSLVDLVLDGEGVFEFLHARFQILDFSPLLFQEQMFNSV